MRIEIPEAALVALVGVSGSGKTTFAERHFKPTEVLSSDFFRALVSDDENNQLVNRQAFDALYYVAEKRLGLGLLTVVDATNVQREDRACVLRLAREQDYHAVAIVLDIPEAVCKERNKNRLSRSFGGHVVTRQSGHLRRSIRSLQKEGFRFVFILKGEEEVAGAEIVRTPIWNDKRSEKGPFDIIGDLHGCFDELCGLLAKLGYTVDTENCTATPPKGRRAVFLGDLCDRGPKNIEVLRLVMGMVKAGDAFCVAGNHDVKLLRKLKGADVQITHGLDITLGQLDGQSAGFISETKSFLDGLISHYVFDGGGLVVAHAGLLEKYQGRASARVRDFCLFGSTTGETDEYGLPVRLPWADEYRGRALVVYGHTPTPTVEAVNNTYCIDTGCVFGGGLTCFRYPENMTVEVAAQREYYAPARPLRQKQERGGDVLDIADVLGKKYLTTRLRPGIKIEAENAAAALELMSRFAADPHWLIYLPPTMSPCETSKLPGYLEHPGEAFAHYRSRGVERVVCEQKHMGSRAVVVLCRDAETACSRFGMCDGSSGIVYTRTGRRFFDDAETESTVLARLNNVLTAKGFWDDFGTGWLCLDTELMPWSAKAQKLLEEQYAAVGRAGRCGLSAALGAIEGAVALHCGDAPSDGGLSDRDDLPLLLERYKARAGALDLFTDAYRRYCWDVAGVDDLRIAPFHLLATEGRAWCGENHVWHLGTIRKYMTGSDPIFITTDHLPVELSDVGSVGAGVGWWEGLTASGGEGMVVKPFDFIPARGAELLQPAIKCRGPEYLRIIYGPEYMLGGNLERLKKRSLSRKRGLALKEFALGVEGLERFVRREPLHRVHECVFGVLALESEPVDPRL